MTTAAMQRIEITSVSTYHTIALTDTPSTLQVTTYRKLRLGALRSDPSSFGATYEKERGYSEEVWRSRLDRKGAAATILARLDGPEDLSRYGGIVTVVAATGLIALDGPLPHGVDKKRAYLICGMWVHQKHRGRRVGEKVMEAAVEWARENAGQRGIKDGQVWLHVFTENTVAQRLYKKLGFEQVGGEEELAPGKMMVAMMKNL